MYMKREVANCSPTTHLRNWWKYIYNKMGTISFPKPAWYSFWWVIPKDFLRENRVLIPCLPLICYRVEQTLVSSAPFHQKSQDQLFKWNVTLDRCELKNFGIVEIRGFLSWNAIIINIIAIIIIYALSTRIVKTCCSHNCYALTMSFSKPPCSSHRNVTEMSFLQWLHYESAITWIALQRKCNFLAIKIIPPTPVK